MPKRSQAQAGALPSREELIAFIAEKPGKVGKREIARAFGITGSDRSTLKDLLRELEDDGVVSRHRRSLRKRHQLPPVVVADIVGHDSDGEILAEPEEWDRESLGPAPRIVITGGRKPRGGVAAPGIGDRVLVRLARPTEAQPYGGRIVKVIGRRPQEMLGIFRTLPGGGGRLVPVDKKARGREVMVAPGDEGSARDGDLVSASAAGRNRFGLMRARIRERLGPVDSEKAISLIAIHAHGIPDRFSAEALAEAERARPVGLEGREDWRELPLVTIDPPDAKDHDDAVHAAPDADPGNPGGFVLTVAIADVAAYVRPGSALDREALERGNSVYFPDRVVPMLPERISNDLCSLRPGEARPAIAVRMVIDAEGRKRRHGFARIVMRSAAKLAYAQAQAAIDGSPDEVTRALLGPVLQPLWAAYAALKRARARREPLDLDLPERKILLTPDGKVDRVLIPERLDAHRLIEEFMILANVAAAETLEKAGSPLVYRVHDEPSLDKMRTLAEVMASIGVKLPKQGALKPALFNRILRGVEGSEHQLFVNEVVLRSQAQAAYAAENEGHFGLNLRRYAHFTSPIRRYADLIVHRALIRALKLGSDGLPAATSVEQLAEIGARISATERRAMAAERETADRLIAHHLASRIGARFEGRVSGVTRAGLFVRLTETGADGFVPAASIGNEYVRYDEAGHALIGERSGESWRLGDPVEVELVEAAPVAGALRFALISPGRRRGAARASRPGAAEREREQGKAVRSGRRKGKDAWTATES